MIALREINSAIDKIEEAVKHIIGRKLNNTEIVSFAAWIQANMAEEHIPDFRTLRNEPIKKDVAS